MLGATLAAILGWALVAGIAAFHVALYFTYRPILWERKKEIQSILGRGHTFKRYVRAFGSSDAKDAGVTVNNLFYAIFGKKRYYFPVTFVALTASLAATILEIYAKVPLLPLEIRSLVYRLPAESIAALGGAVIWGMYDAVQRFDAIDLSPTSLNYNALRALLVPVIAPLVGAPFVGSVRLLVAFAVGVFPITTLVDFVSGQARTRLSFTAEPVEKPTLQFLQGVTPSMLQHLRDQGFESAEHLAGADPVRFLLKTNIPWKVILDLIDQAILFGYVQENIRLLPVFGIRGAIELATIQQDLDDDDQKVRDAAGALVVSVAKKLGTDEPAVRNMVKNAWEDVQVNLIWSFWGDEEITDKSTDEHSSKL